MACPWWIRGSDTRKHALPRSKQATDPWALAVHLCRKLARWQLNEEPSKMRESMDKTDLGKHIAIKHICPRYWLWSGICSFYFILVFFFLEELRHDVEVVLWMINLKIICIISTYVLNMLQLCSIVEQMFLLAEREIGLFPDDGEVFRKLIC